LWTLQWEGGLKHGLDNSPKWTVNKTHKPLGLTRPFWIGVVMSLSSWFETHNISYRAVANAATVYLREAGLLAPRAPAVRESTIRRYALPLGHEDRRVPREPYITAIYVLTGGAVQPNDLHDLPELTAATKQRAAQLLDEAKRSAARAAHAGRMKGAKAAARSVARRRAMKKGRA
jgi:hypothetical protein